MIQDDFKGFSPATIQFFKDLSENNNKEWFEANRGIYETEVLARFKQFVNALSPIMSTIDTHFEVRPQRVLSRIYRDVRFSKNKDPYKSCLWMSFQLPVKMEEWKDYPGFFIEISDEGYVYGMGLAQAKRAVMDDYRDHVSYRAEEFKEETEKLLKLGFVIGGEEYKRTIPNKLPEYYQPWIQRKGIWLSKTKPIGCEMYDTDFVKVIVDEFRQLEWLYNFLKQSQPE